MKKAETIMEILAAYDLTGSHRARNQLIGPFREKIEEWVDATHGRVRADVGRRSFEAMGYTGSERTPRRAVAEAKAAYRAGHRRRFGPWLAEPGLWFQWDYAAALQGHRDKHGLEHLHPPIIERFESLSTRQQRQERPKSQAPRLNAIEGYGIRLGRFDRRSRGRASSVPVA
ncbi:MAG: hypothetical protein JOZ81_13930 [Chloroflexi bacterium]|nr:hypothetical protein [Chloroflexota bacterium]